MSISLIFARLRCRISESEQKGVEARESLQRFYLTKVSLCRYSDTRFKDDKDLILEAPMMMMMMMRMLFGGSRETAGEFKG